MTDGGPRHPAAEIMSAFVDGTLAPHELADVTNHLRDCAECRFVAAESARFGAEEAPAIELSATPKRWLLALAAAVAIAVIATPLFIVIQRALSPVTRLIAAAPREHRYVEARISGFRWARLQAPARGTATVDPADLQFDGAAGKVLDSVAQKNDRRSQHARGVAFLVIGRYDEAISALRRAAEGSNDAQAWSDLAAARLAAAAAKGRASEVPDAVADAQEALKIDPRFAEAHFNLALALERLGTTDRALAEWRRYLEIDSSTAWSSEAREHVRALSRTSRRWDPRLLESFPVDELVREYAQEVRSSAEVILLNAWAGGGAAGDAALARAHAIGDALVTHSSEHLLADAVAAIERSSDTEHVTIAEAARVYYSARRAYSVRDVASAEAGFRRAEGLFRASTSPMAVVAQYYVASAAFDQRRGDEARATLERLLGSVDARRYRALTAQIRWELAVIANADGDWGTAIRHADAASAIFRSLGETANAAFTDGVGANAYELAGERDLAWSRRARAFAALSDESRRARRNPLLFGAALTLTPLGRAAAAGAMLDLVLDDMRDDPAQLTLALALRARDALRSGDAATAAASLASAGRSAMKVRDAALRESAEADVDIARAALETRTSPAAAVHALDRSIHLFAHGRLRMRLPGAYLERARAERARRDDRAALANYAAAMDEIEKQAATMTNADERLAFFDTASQVVEESIDLQLEHGAQAEAFSISERSRALLAPAAGTLRWTPAALPQGAAVIEYAELPESLAVFCATRAGISAARVPIARRELDAEIEGFVSAIRRRAPDAEVRSAGAALERLLVAPVRAQLAGVGELTIVPDRALYAVPFAALWDATTGGYLIERYTLRFAGSAQAEADQRMPLGPALVVADPVTQMARLAASRDEAAHIASLTHGSLLAGEAATRQQFVALAKTSALIHYAGHANSDASESFGALLFTPASGDDGILGSGDIARLDLTIHPLVVLAACGTFRGETSHVAGMSSIARAFLRAGARGVAGTLWEIDDDVSAPLFTKFHERLRAGALPAHALQDAQLAMMRTSDRRAAAPATWAPVEYIMH
jgi:CHAT domain-containing protein